MAAQLRCVAMAAAPTEPVLSDYVRVRRKKTTIFLWADPADTAVDLKAKIHKITKVPAVDMKLFIDKNGEVVLDENLVAKANTASSFTAVGNMKTSPSQEVLAWTCDTFGGETYDLIISDISKGSNADKIPKELDRIKDVDSGIVWGADDKTVYYLKMDDEHRPFQVWRHTVGEVKGVL